MVYYDVKPYNVFGLQYVGESTFCIEIFSTYAVEKRYGKIDIPMQNGCVTHNCLGCEISGKFQLNDLDLDEINGGISYNAKSTGCHGYEIVICDRHLMGDNYTQVKRIVHHTYVILIKFISSIWIKFALFIDN